MNNFFKHITALLAMACIVVAITLHIGTLISNHQWWDTLLNVYVVSVLICRLYETAWEVYYDHANGKYN